MLQLQEQDVIRHKRSPAKNRRFCKKLKGSHRYEWIAVMRWSYVEHCECIYLFRLHCVSCGRHVGLISQPLLDAPFDFRSE